MPPFVTHRHVEFADTDMAGIVHFARFFVFMETAEHELLRSCGVPVHFDHEGLHLGWPRGAASCRYHSPARVADRLDIRVEVVRRGRSSVTYRTRISHGDRLIAEGDHTAICCVLGEPGGLRSAPIPEFLARQLDHYVAAESSAAAPSQATPEEVPS